MSRKLINNIANAPTFPTLKLGIVTQCTETRRVRGIKRIQMGNRIRAISTSSAFETQFFPVLYETPNGSQYALGARGGRFVYSAPMARALTPVVPLKAGLKGLNNPLRVISHESSSFAFPSCRPRTPHPYAFLISLTCASADAPILM